MSDMIYHTARSDVADMMIQEKEFVKLVPKNIRSSVRYRYIDSPISRTRPFRPDKNASSM
jgi:hypothetical protein